MRSNLASIPTEDFLQIPSVFRGALNFPPLFPPVQCLPPGPKKNSVLNLTVVSSVGQLSRSKEFECLTYFFEFKKYEFPRVHNFLQKHEIGEMGLGRDPNKITPESSFLGVSRLMRALFAPQAREVRY